ncbi:MAG: hypothetical protein WCP03_02655 [Candidatus Saccharibacteria bacterium]
MVQNNQIQSVDKSRLDRLVLSFEYDKTLQQVKRDMRLRTLNKK